jgi:hypothetical protein
MEILKDALLSALQQHREWSPHQPKQEERDNKHFRYFTQQLKKRVRIKSTVQETSIKQSIN